MSVAIEARDVFRVYASDAGNTAALQGLTLEIGTGSIAAVLGPSGSGKSTFLRLLAGLDQPRPDQCGFRGRPRKQSRRRRATYRARELGYLEQLYWRSLDPHISARELVALQLGLAGAPRTQRLGRADELLARVGLGARGSARPSQLSGGEQSALPSAPRSPIARACC